MSVRCMQARHIHALLELASYSRIAEDLIDMASHLDEGITFSYVCQKLIAKPFSLASPFDQASNIHKLSTCGQHCLGFAELA